MARSLKCGLIFIGNMPKRVDCNPESFVLELFKGAATSQLFQYTDANEAPVNISSFTISLILIGVFNTTLKLSSGDAHTALGSFIEITDGPNGKFAFTISDEETATAKVGVGRYAIQIDEGDGYPYILWRDAVQISDI
jgi:hypothetical protein